MHGLWALLIETSLKLQLLEQLTMKIRISFEDSLFEVFPWEEHQSGLLRYNLYCMFSQIKVSKYLIQAYHLLGTNEC